MNVTLTRPQIAVLLLALRLFRMRSLFIAVRSRFPDERARLRADADMCKRLIVRLEKPPA